MSFLKVQLIAGMEHTKGYNLLAKHVSAFGYWTIKNLDNDSLSEKNFYKLLNNLNICNIKNENEFKKEFNFLINKMDPRFFSLKDGASFKDRIEEFRNRPDVVKVNELGVSNDEFIKGLDIEGSIFGFELFKQIFLERNL